MLENINLDTVFRVARHKGFESCKIYCEESLQTQIQSNGIQHQSNFLFQAGISLELTRQNKAFHYFTSTLTTNALLSLLETNESNSFTTPEFVTSTFSEIESQCLISLKNKQNAFKNWAKQFETENVECNYTEEIKRFNTVTEKAGLTSTSEEKAQWVKKTRGLPLIYHANSSINEFWQQLDPSNSIQKTKLNSTTWPAPEGTLPIYFSSKCVANLLLPFIRSFEADLLLGSQSLLANHDTGFNFKFNIIEKLQSHQPTFDHEGTERKSISLLESGTAQSLALNLKLAEILNQNSTGHGRRASYLYKPTICFWNPEMVAQNESSNILSQMNSGLCVEDLVILDFNPNEKNVRLKLAETYLVHQGEVGEPIVPVVIECSLFTLLESLSTFSSTKSKWGFWIEKNQQNLLTEILCPAALSSGVFIPGTVPSETYFG